MCGQISIEPSYRYRRKSKPMLTNGHMEATSFTFIGKRGNSFVYREERELMFIITSRLRIDNLINFNLSQKT